MRFRVLGPLEAYDADGGSLPFNAAKPRTLLALLLIHANRPVSVEELTAALWPLRPPPTAAGALRTHMSTLRRTLGVDGPAVRARPPGYQVDLSTADLDRLVFEELARQGRQAAAQGDLAAAAQLWSRALGLWRGRPLDGLELGPVAEAELADLAERRLTMLEDWAQAELTLGHHADLLSVLGPTTAEQPLRERLHELAMLALYRAGRQSDALATFRLLRRRLVAELGIEPSPPLQRLQRQILAGDPALDAPARTPPPPSGAPVPRQLPPDVGAFTGRAREVANGRERVPGKILAIAGAGGIGKSALAIHLAHRLAHRFPDGQLYVDLQGAAAGLPPLEPRDVLSRFLRALAGAAGFGGMAGGAGAGRDGDLETVAEASAAFRALTAPRRLLVVLDNARDAAQVRPLLPAGPHTGVLVTSRRILSTLDGAVHLNLDVLPEREAVRLLGRLAGPERIAADPAAAGRVARCCGYLPLALRIAGARLAARPNWPMRELAARVGDAQHRLDELQIAELGVRSSFQVGYEMLRDSADPADQAAARAFPLLGLPEGADLSLPAAAALLDLAEPEAERCLERLVDGQLVASLAPGRYRLHDLLRLFARELTTRLPGGAATGALTRMLRWYLSTAWQAFRRLRPGDPRPDTAGHWAEGGRPFPTVDAALRWLEAERTNLLAAVHQVAGGEDLPAPIATQLARALFAFFHVRGYLVDWVEVCETALAVARRLADPVAEAHACRDLGAAHEVRGDYRKAEAYLRDGLALYRIAGDLTGQAACLNSLGAVHDSLGQLAEAAGCLEQSLTISRAVGDRHSQGISLNNLSTVYGNLGAYARAVDCLSEALGIFRQSGNRRSVAASLGNLGEVYERQGAYAEAVSSYRQSLAVFRELGNALGEAAVLGGLGRVHRLHGRHSQALDCLGAALALAESTGDRRGVAACLRELGLVSEALGDLVQARAHWRQALDIFEGLGVPEAAEVRGLLAPGPVLPDQAGWARRAAGQESR
jgi:DNA-binding SARP family transcriptional activator/tetratricopeptide (TPR) repeat protein